METAAGVAASRGVSLPMPSSQPSRKEWRAVSEHSSRNVGSEVQQGRDPADVDSTSVTIDGSLDKDILQQRFNGLVRQREGLQQMEIELRAQIIARSQIMAMQNGFDAQIKEYSSANVKLQEQLHEMEQTIHELERRMEDKDRELHAIKLDNEAAWAKEDLIREQSKELLTFRRERDNSESERAQHLTQIHDLQEHIQDKDRQFLELQEQHRIAQETIVFRDDQLREAQAWIARVQEMDALQSTTHHSLQAELRERTEQYNQLWLGCQQQFSEMERLHLHTIQQLQLELADARDRSGTCPDESRSQSNSNDASQFGQNNGNQLNVNGSVTPSASPGALPNGNSENVSSVVSTGNVSTRVDHVHGVPIAPSSLLGLPTYLPPGQVTALHPFIMHQQGFHSEPSHVTQSHIGNFHSIPAISSLQHWQNQQATSESSQAPTHPSQIDQNLLKPDINYDYEVSGNGQYIRPEYLDLHVSHGAEPDTVNPALADDRQVLVQADKSYMVAPQPQQSLQHISSQFRDALKIDPVSQNSETKDNITTSTNHGLDGQGFATEQSSSPANTSSSETSFTDVNFSETTMSNPTALVSSESYVSSGQINVHAGGKTSESALLDEGSLLACIVRTIPPGSGGRIRISSTLPNRLSKMLAPLHWHDYKKKYGRLDDFVAGHPELFVIEGDYIQLQEGAQEIIAATAAVAKVAAAAKTASSLYSSLLPSVAVTPMAQSHRLKRAPSIDSNSAKTDKTIFNGHAASTPACATDDAVQPPVQNHHSNGVCLNAGVSNIKIFSKPKDSLDLTGTESKPGQSSGLVAVGNGATLDRSGLGNSISKGAQGRPSMNVVGKQQGRATGVASTFRR